MKTCKVENCDRQARVKKYCKGHYYRLYNTGSLYLYGSLVLGKSNFEEKKCLIENCKMEHYAKGYCEFHWRRNRKGGNLNTPKHYKDKKYPEGCISMGCNNENSSGGYCGTHSNRLKKNIPFGRPIGIKGELNPRWSGGVSEYPNHYLMKKNRKIILGQHSICQNCKIKPAIEVHHIDESKDNHSLDNLMAVCSKCNSNLRSNKKNNSKYKRLHGKTLSEFSQIYNISIATVKKLLENNISIEKYNLQKKEKSDKKISKILFLKDGNSKYKRLFGKTLKEIAKEHNISDSTAYLWIKKGKI